MDSALPISSTISSISTKDVNTVIRALHKTLMVFVLKLFIINLILFFY